MRSQARVLCSRCGAEVVSTLYSDDPISKLNEQVQWFERTPDGKSGQRVTGCRTCVPREQPDVQPPLALNAASIVLSDDVSQ